MPFGWFKSSSKEKSGEEAPSNLQAANDEIDNRMSEEKRTMKRSASLLLLGAGGCGKSTLYKQIRNIYNGEIPEKEMIVATMSVKRQVFDDMMDLCRTNVAIISTDKECEIEDEKARDLRDRFVILSEKLSTDIELTYEIAQDIKHLWSQSGMKKTFNICSKSHVMESTPYFFNKVLEIGSPQYLANFDDYVRVRHRTVGLLHSTFNTSFQSHSWVIKLTDVGGQKNERKKWIQVFADIDAVLYVMSLNGYDKLVYEDNSKNCWDESFQIFSDLSALKVFDKTTFIVFLNKADLLEELLKQVPFNVYYKDCPLDKINDYSYVVSYAQEVVTQRFEAGSIKLFGDKDFQRRALHFHVTCATDRDQMEKVLQVLQVEATKSQLQTAGLL